MKTAIVLAALLLLTGVQSAPHAAVGYVTITNYAGFIIPGVGDPGSPGWTSSFVGIEDFENNASHYVRSNTNSIQASLRTDSSTQNRTLRFDIQGPVAIDTSYTELATTNATVNGHRYTAARFDWTMSLPMNSAGDNVRLKLCPGWAEASTPHLWAVQPGRGLHSGHVEVTGFDVWDICFQIAIVDESLVPEPSSSVALASGLVGLGWLLQRKRPLG